MPLLATVEAYSKDYRGQPFSGAFICCWFVYILVIVFPLILCLETNNFWQKQSIGSEAIEYRFRNEFLLYVLENNESKVYSNLQHFEKYIGSENQLQGPSISSFEIDKNDDGVPDKFEGQISFVSDSDKVQQCMLVLFFDSYFRNDTNIRVSGQLKYDVYSRSGLSNARLYSRVVFKQRQPLPRVQFEKTYYEENVFVENHYDVIDSLLAYERRDFKMTPEYNEVQTGGQGGKKTTINVEIDLDNTQQILYNTRMIGRFKFAWVQYVSVFIPFWFLGRSFLRFLYRYKFFYTSSINNLPRKKEDYFE